MAEDEDDDPTKGIGIDDETRLYPPGEQDPSPADAPDDDQPPDDHDDERE